MTFSKKYITYIYFPLTQTFCTTNSIWLIPILSYYPNICHWLIGQTNWRRKSGCLSFGYVSRRFTLVNLAFTGVIGWFHLSIVTLVGASTRGSISNCSRQVVSFGCKSRFVDFNGTSGEESWWIPSKEIDISDDHIYEDDHIPLKYSLLPITQFPIKFNRVHPLILY